MTRQGLAYVTVDMYKIHIFLEYVILNHMLPFRICSTHFLQSYGPRILLLLSLLSMGYGSYHLETIPSLADFSFQSLAFTSLTE